MEDSVTRPGTRNGGLSNVLEIERLIMQKQLVMNQSAISAPAAFFFFFSLRAFPTARR